MLNENDRVWCVRFIDEDGNSHGAICTSPEELGKFMQVNATDVQHAEITQTTSGALADGAITSADES